ncbi:MAG: hypothetical protein JSV67_02355 [Thermoplasmatales archaeon]|nr:MAG: hypothetical protein JSV67_02355 [Thermoplasmatales archaeon]
MLNKFDIDKRYSLTKDCEEELEMNLNTFFVTFYDIDEIRKQWKCNQD